MSPSGDDFSVDAVDLSGTHLVEAGAGTGKTHQIVRLFLRLLLGSPDDAAAPALDVSQILVVTYTVAATAELRERIRNALVAAADREPDARRRERAVAALRGFDAAAIFTIHGFCQRVLRERAFESGSSFESELVSDAEGLVDEVAEDYWARELYAAPRLWALHLTANRWLPDRLAVLAAQTAARPDLELRPPRAAAPPELAPLEQALREAHTRVSNAWSGCRDDVIALLVAATEADSLNKGSYRLERIRESWRGEIDRDVASDPSRVAASGRGWQRIAWLASGTLRSRTKKGGVTPEHLFFDLCQRLVDAREALSHALRAHLSVFLHDFVAYARDELARRKRERDVLFFDDLLLRLSGALEGEGGDALADAVRRRWPVALIDEFQDTDPIQYAVFRRIWRSADAGARALFLIGDPKQAIYGFRGADVFAYLEARADAGDRVHPLARNWRSDPALLAGLNAVFGASERPFLLEEIPYAPATPRPGAADALAGARIRSGLRLLEVPSSEPGQALPREWKTLRLVRAVAGEVARVLSAEQRIADGEGGERPLRPGDVAVLTRTNRQARDLQSALREVGIAAVLRSEESVFATDEATELERVLRAVSDPEDPARVRAAIATTLLSRSAQECLDRTGGADSDPEAAEAWDAWIACLRECRGIWAEHGLPQALRGLWRQRGVVERLLGRTDGERRVTNLQHLIELLHREASEARLGPLALLYWLGRRRAEARAGARVVAEEVQLRLESDAEAVQLLTVHRAKGLQFPVTICPYLWDGSLLRRIDEFYRYHDPDADGLVLEPKALASDAGRRLARREAFAENLRLAYVALTRARHHCSLVWGRYDDLATSPLRHWIAPDPSPPGDGAWDEKARERFSKKVTDADLRGALERLTAEASGGIVRAPLDATAPPRSARRAGAPGPSAPVEAAALESRVATRSFPPVWRVSSFSGLVASFAPGLEAEVVAAAAPASPAFEEGRDYDALATAEAGAERAVDPGPEPTASGPEEVRLAAFPAGAMPGILIHEIFEELDFVAADGPALEDLVARKLRSRNLSLSWTAGLAQAVREVLAVPLADDEPATRLGTLTRAERVDEMPFTLPVAADEPVRGRLTAQALGDVFERHAVSPRTRDYAGRIRQLGFAPLAGHLRGFIDLVFRRGDRFYLADYKSNRLGPRAADYAGEALGRAVVEHDYVLQYHLYLVALHRHLAFRLPGYDYDVHLGGAYYLFVRGMSPQHPAGCGVLFDRPPRELIEALSGLLAGETGP